jgi:hypothetical protein
MVDPGVVELRDAIAHGRVSAAIEDDDLLLLKFAKPSENRTTVTFAQRLTSAWLREQIGRVAAELRKVVGA